MPTFSIPESGRKRCHSPSRPGTSYQSSYKRYSKDHQKGAKDVKWSEHTHDDIDLDEEIENATRQSDYDEQDWTVMDDLDLQIFSEDEDENVGNKDKSTDRWVLEVFSI